jgi:hypothetical protein
MDPPLVELHELDLSFHLCAYRDEFGAYLPQCPLHGEFRGGNPLLSGFKLWLIIRLMVPRIHASISEVYPGSRRRPVFADEHWAQMAPTRSLVQLPWQADQERYEITYNEDSQTSSQVFGPYAYESLDYHLQGVVAEPASPPDGTSDGRSSQSTMTTGQEATNTGREDSSQPTPTMDLFMLGRLTTSPTSVRDIVCAPSGLPLPTTQGDRFPESSANDSDYYLHAILDSGSTRTIFSKEAKCMFVGPLRSVNLYINTAHAGDQLQIQGRCLFQQCAICREDSKKCGVSVRTGQKWL